MLSYHPGNISTLQNDLDKEEGERKKGEVETRRSEDKKGNNETIKMENMSIEVNKLLCGVK